VIGGVWDHLYAREYPVAMLGGIMYRGD